MTVTPAPHALRLATWNVRGLHAAGYSPWPRFAPYDHHEYEGKLTFLESRLRRDPADFVAIQEVGSASAFVDLARRLEDVFPHSTQAEPGGRSKLANALLSRWPLTEARSVSDIPPRGRIRLDESGRILHDRFRRPLLCCRASFQGTPITLYSVHLKSQAPDFIEHEVRGDDPVILARALARSQAQRLSEAVGLRALTHETLSRGGGHVAILGDLNDGLEALSTELLGDAPGPKRRPTGEVAPDRLYNLGALTLRRRSGDGPPLHTHLWNERPGVLDHIIASGELAARLAGLDVQNDFLEAARTDRCASDHALVTARFDAT